MIERREIAVYGRSNLTNPATPVSARNAPEIVKCVGQAAEFAWEEFFRVASIDVSTKIGLRDRAVLAVLIYTAARVGAVAKLTLKSVKHDGSQYTLRFSEKGGKSREIPVRHDLELALLAYMEAAAITEGPLFRTAAGKTEKLTENPMTGIDICRMMKRRLKAAGLPGQYSPHSFRVKTPCVARSAAPMRRRHPRGETRATRRCRRGPSACRGCATCR